MNFDKPAINVKKFGLGVYSALRRDLMLLMMMTVPMTDLCRVTFSGLTP